MARHCIYFDVYDWIMVADGINIVWSFVLMAYLPDLKSFLDQAKYNSMQAFQEIGQPLDERAIFGLDLIKTLLPWAVQCCCFLFIIGFISGGLLLYGVHKKKGSFMLPWLIVKFATLNGATTSIVGGAVVLCMTPIPVYWALALLGAAIPMLTLGYFTWSFIHVEYNRITQEVPNDPKGQGTILHSNDNIRNAMAYNSKAYVKMLDIIEETHSKQNPEAKYIRILDTIEDPEPAVGKAELGGLYLMC